MIKWLLVFILIAPLAFAQDETMAPLDEDNPSTIHIPNGSDCTGTACNAANCALEVDDDPSSPDGLEIMTNVDQAAVTIKFTMANPTADVSQGAGAQVVNINMTRMFDPGGTGECTEDTADGGTDPPFWVRLYCNGVSKNIVFADPTNVTTQDEFHTAGFTYTVDGDCDAAGANAEFLVDLGRAGGGANRRMAAINAIEWDVTHASAGPSGPGVFFLGKLWEKLQLWWA